MALFPAFTGIIDTDTRNKDLEWLNNPSFSSSGAANLHQQARESHTAAQSPSSLQTPEEDEEYSVRSKKKKKKEKKKKRKEKKQRRGGSESDLDSDTLYPSDLLKRKETNTDREDSVSEGKFVWLDDLQTPTDRPFCIDRTADSANWEYKSLYRGDIARYRRKSSSVLGLDSRTQAVSWDDLVQDKKRVDRKPERYFSKTVQQLLRSEPITVLPTEPNASTTNPTDPASFLPLPSCPELQNASCQPSVSVVNPLGVYDPSTSLYVEGKGHSELKEVQDNETSTALLTSRVEEFNRKLRENLTDIQLWLDFIRFQDDLGGVSGLFSGQQSDREFSKLSQRALLERKLSIVDRALESNPVSVELKLERLRLCKELWEPSDLLKEWKKLVFIHPNSAPLWRNYILFTQSYFSSFSVSKVTGVYGKCLSTLSSVQDGCMVSHSPLPGTEKDMLEIFVLQCHFLRQAGHSERAVSLFQALLDFTFNKPDSVKHLNTRQQVEFFEPFWDSGEARVGEKGARGWRAWMLQQERGGWVIPPETDEEDDEDQDECEIRDKTQPKWKIWLELEASREEKHWLPWRPDKTKGQSEEDCEDPDRQVLFDDIGPSLIRVESAGLKLHLLLSFLQFLGLPIPSASPPHSLLLDDPALLNLSTDSNRTLTFQHLLTGVSAVGQMTYLSGCRKQAGLCKDGEEFVKNVLEQTLPLFPTEDRTTLSLCWILYEKLKVLRCVCSGNKKRVKTQVKNSKRVCKRLLKQLENRGSLSLWQEYGHVEWIVGNVEEGRRVFDTALAVGGALGLQDPALCELCLLYAQLEVEQTFSGGAESSAAPPSGSRAVHILTKLAEGAKYTPFSGQVNPVAILKARRAYEQAVSATSACGKAWSALIGCFGLFQYLTMGIDAADAVFTESRDRLVSDLSGSAEHEGSLREFEAVSVQYVALLRLHSSTSVFPLSRLRLALTDALKFLPCSAHLWHLYLMTESRYYSAGRTRRFFHTFFTRNSQSIIPHLFAITAEQRRRQHLDSVMRSGLPADALPVFPETGLSNRIRSLFEIAVTSEQGAHCPVLWRMYLNFTVCNGDIERGRGIFYKALQDVPWSKGLYMDAVGHFPDRIQEVLDVLMEKQLRLRAPLEEVDILLEE